MIAAVAVIAVAVVAYVASPGARVIGADAIEVINGSHALAELEAERQQLIAMTAAAETLTVVTKPRLASPGSIASADPGSATVGGGLTYIPSTPPDPSTAQAIAYNMMASFGFPPTTYFGCLQDLWQRESGWSYDAENPSGAFGIPQALPGSKMASAGADWQTDPATQIRWGLGYIKAQYGNPCRAWAFEEANGFY